MTCGVSLLAFARGDMVFGEAPLLPSTIGVESLSARVLLLVIPQSNMSGLKIIPDEESAADWKW